MYYKGILQSGANLQQFSKMKPQATGLSHLSSEKVALVLIVSSSCWHQRSKLKVDNLNSD